MEEKRKGEGCRRRRGKEERRGSRRVSCELQTHSALHIAALGRSSQPEELKGALTHGQQDHLPERS